MRLDNMKYNRKRAPHSILSEAEAQQILDANSDEEASELGRKFKVQQQTVYKIRKRIAWKHLSPASH